MHYSCVNFSRTHKLTRVTHNDLSMLKLLMMLLKKKQQQPPHSPVIDIPMGNNKSFVGGIKRVAQPHIEYMRKTFAYTF